MQFTVATLVLALTAASNALTLPYSCSAKAHTPSPPLLTCGSHGTLQHASYLGAAYSANVTGCASDCLNDLQCLTFGFDTAKNQCQKLDNLLIFQGFQTKANVTEAYYDKLCFDCVLVYDQPAQGNNTNSYKNSNAKDTNTKSGN